MHNIALCRVTASRNNLPYKTLRICLALTSLSCAQDCWIWPFHPPLSGDITWLDAASDIVADEGQEGACLGLSRPIDGRVSGRRQEPLVLPQSHWDAYTTSSASPSLSTSHLQQIFNERDTIPPDKPASR